MARVCIQEVLELDLNARVSKFWNFERSVGLVKVARVGLRLESLL